MKNSTQSDRYCCLADKMYWGRGGHHEPKLVHLPWRTLQVSDCGEAAVSWQLPTRLRETGQGPDGSFFLSTLHHN